MKAYYMFKKTQYDMGIHHGFFVFESVQGLISKEGFGLSFSKYDLGMCWNETYFYTAAIF